MNSIKQVKFISSKKILPKFSLGRRSKHMERSLSTRACALVEMKNHDSKEINQALFQLIS